MEKEKEKNIYPDPRFLEAVMVHKYKWPKELTSGVMFYRGLRITVLEFMELSKQLN